MTMQANEMDRLLSPKELAAAVGYSHRTIQRWRAEGFVMIHHRATLRGLLSWLQRRDSAAKRVRVSSPVVR